MIRILLVGCFGQMGQAVSRLVKQEEEMRIAAGIDPGQGVETDFPVYASLAAYEEAGEKERADVIIDFSSAKGTDALLDYCAATNTPCVLCTTGLDEAQLEKVRLTSGQTAILRSANMTLGISLLKKLVREAAAVLAPAGFDIEIVEQHHRRKVDAPSGTAIALADAANEGLEESYAYVCDRSGRNEKRPRKEIGLSSVRGGTIVGVHDVIFAGEDEVITISHTAYSRTVFAKGAVSAAKYLVGKSAGLYDMSDVIEA